MRECIVCMMRKGVIQQCNHLCSQPSCIVHSLVNLAIISYNQRLTAAAYGTSDNTADTDNRFECQVQFGSTLDGSVPMAKWYINNMFVNNVAGATRFKQIDQSFMTVDSLKKTVTSTLTITQGQAQDSGVYECRFTWIGYNVSHKFYFAIIGKYYIFFTSLLLS